MWECVTVGLGGFLGSCLRFGLTSWMRGWAISLPLGTLLSNILAGFFIGFVVGLEPSPFAPRAKLFLTTGLCGGLSTFSTFSLETITLLRDGNYPVACLNILLNLGVSLLAVVLGLLLAKLIFKKAA
ncbi:MAG: fluoride efflux transporter CrcB [Oscillibacter sp.]